MTKDALLQEILSHIRSIFWDSMLSLLKNFQYLIDYIHATVVA